MQAILLMNSTLHGNCLNVGTNSNRTIVDVTATILMKQQFLSTRHLRVFLISSENISLDDSERNDLFIIGICLCYLTLKVLVTTIDAQWKGMGDVGSVRYEPALLSPCPTIRVLSYSN